jgi:hypothetical protein
MRRIIAAALVLASVSPAMAAPRHPDADHDDQAIAAAAGRLADPATARAAGKAMAAMTGALLDLRVDGIRRAADPFRDRPQGDQGEPRTLRDMVAPDDRNLDRRVEADTAGAVAAAGSAVQGMAAMAPVLRAQAEELQRSFQRALDTLQEAQPPARR